MLSVCFHQTELYIFFDFSVQLSRKRFLEALFIVCKHQALAEPERQHDVFLAVAAAAVVGEKIVAKRLHAARVVKALTMVKGMRRRTDADIRAAAPVERVVTALKAGLGKVGDFVLRIAETIQIIHGKEIQLCLFVLVGQVQCFSLSIKRRAFLNFQYIR